MKGNQSSVHRQVQTAKTSPGLLSISSPSTTAADCFCKFMITVISFQHAKRIPLLFCSNFFFLLGPHKSFEFLIESLGLDGIFFQCDRTLVTLPGHQLVVVYLQQRLLEWEERSFCSQQLFCCVLWS
jgi:hypothetical protein